MPTAHREWVSRCPRLAGEICPALRRSRSARVRLLGYRLAIFVAVPVAIFVGALIAGASASAAKRASASVSRPSLRFLCAHPDQAGSLKYMTMGCPSLFRMPLPRHPRLLRGSSTASRAMVDRIMSMGAGGVRPLQVNPAQGEDYGHPVFYSQPSDPLYRVHCDKSAAEVCPIEGWLIHIPQRARPADGSDGHMAVLDVSTDTEYDFYQVQTVPLPTGGGTITISWGGWSLIGAWDAGSNESCADAACTPLSGGLIRYSEVAAARIDHALFIVVGCTNGSAVYPAADAGEACDDARHAPATGQWLQLDMSSASIDRLPAAPWEKALLHAFARYGAMIGDQGSNGGFDFMAESPETYTSLGRANPFVAWAARQRRGPRSHVDAYVADGSTHYAFDLSHLIGWREHLRVLAPCVIAGSC